MKTDNKKEALLQTHVKCDAEDCDAYAVEQIRIASRPRFHYVTRNVCGNCRGKFLDE